MKQKAFTLIELLVVVAIIGILAAVGVVAYNGYTASAKANAVKTIGAQTASKTGTGALIGGGIEIDNIRYSIIHYADIGGIDTSATFFSAGFLF